MVSIMIGKEIGHKKAQKERHPYTPAMKLFLHKSKTYFVAERFVSERGYSLPEGRPCGQGGGTFSAFLW